MINYDFVKYENDKRDEYIRLDTTIIVIDNLIAKASTAEEANALFKAKDVIYSQQQTEQNNLTADERYCRDCIHNEVCRYCPHDGCDFKETPKEAESVKHAQWIRKHNSFPQRYYCTNCGEGAVGRSAFCPNCGYKMGG
ncbi:hypothetical protein [uncultured Ruminococcus sp.]|uniref:hypothetical protein n=1 Tax=uncultured Ruminococcus sp. TaxID=165186 RepID=UPI0025F3242F|nr:hypothetical protein [uncultured Ruminococcus sp.]